MIMGATIWLIIAAVAAGLFFGIAVVVTVYGIRDLRNLLEREKP
jgi:hypothetical protein